MKEKVVNIINRIQLEALGNTSFKIVVEEDRINPRGRIYLQVKYGAPCTKTGETKDWGGRKWYLSQFMTDDEIVKTAFAAFKTVVEHEIMEGFKVDNIILFNPHIHFEELLKVSHKEITRTTAP
jgi:hypothetical protein